MTQEEYRSSLEAIRVQSHNSYDKVLITLSSGGLVTTLTIMSNYLDRQIIEGWMLDGVLITLGLTILLITASFLISAKASAEAIKEIDTPDYSSKGKLKKSVPVINIVSCCLFATGLVLLGIFVSLNFRHAPLLPQ